MNIEELCGDSFSPRVCFIGGGNMATAVIEGCLKSGFLRTSQIAVITGTDASAEKWNAKSILSTSNYSDAKMKEFTAGAIFVLAVKPQMRDDVLRSMAENFYFNRSPLVISLLAGISLDTLSSELTGQGHRGKVIRLFPNTPSAIGCGAVLLSSRSPENSTEVKIARGMAESIGKCVALNDKLFNGAGAVSACSPAWTFAYIESLADGGVLSGVPRSEALMLAAQAVMGAAKLVLESGEHPAALKDRVCSPAGTTIAGLRILEQRGFRGAVIDAVKAASDRADDMK